MFGSGKVSIKKLVAEALAKKIAEAQEELDRVSIGLEQDLKVQIENLTDKFRKEKDEFVQKLINRIVK